MILDIQVIILTIIISLIVFIFSTALTGLLCNSSLTISKKSFEALSAKQATHSKVTTRWGGLAILSSISLFVLYDMSSILVLIMVSSFPIFLAGALEDFGYLVRPVLRLIVGLFSGCLAIFLTGVWLTDIDLSFIGILLTYSPIAILFTIFSSCGVSQSINLIDGMNGLASGVILLISIALSMISFSFGEPDLGIFSLIIFASTLGFFVWNFPKGLIFLGDSGAYSLGHITVWVAILLVSRHPEISAWAILCLFLWPIMDTLFSIFRRRRRNVAIDQPDRMHFHHVIMRAIQIISVQKITKQFANPLATTILLPVTAVPIILGVWFIEDNERALYSVIFTALLFLISYNLLVYLLCSNKFKKNSKSKKSRK